MTIAVPANAFIYCRLLGFGYLSAINDNRTSVIKVIESAPRCKINTASLSKASSALTCSMLGNNLGRKVSKASFAKASLLEYSKDGGFSLGYHKLA